MAVKASDCGTLKACRDAAGKFRNIPRGGKKKAGKRKNPKAVCLPGTTKVYKDKRGRKYCACKTRGGGSKRVPFASRNCPLKKKSKR